ncbi:MAG: hypothetical protein JXB88_23490, partial [Spirochaetales bacterium]|nr:hypothetical protein [Spirochaetales bacterium]
MKKKIVLFAVLILAIAYFPAVAQSGCTCDAGCGSVTNVTVDFSKDGAGDLCFFIPCIGSYINSWNMAVVEINGQDFTNRWAAASSLPATIDGGYYIYYKGNYAWSHFEAKGACSAVTDPPSTPTPITDTPTPITSTATPTPVTVTSPPGVGDVSMSPSTVNANINE